MKLYTSLLLIFALMASNGDKSTYPIGFNLLTIVDSTNTSFRTIPLGIWYPTSGNPGKPDVVMAEYLKSHLRSHEYLVLSTIAINNSSDSVQLWQTLKRPLDAVKNAAFPQKKYPLILYAASINADLGENYEMMEYLSKHGYIVGAISSFGPDYERLKFDLPSVKAQETDMRIALNYLINQPYVDTNKIGVIGFSYGALPAVRLATTNLDIKALVTLDGSHTYFRDLIFEDTLLYKNKVPTPYLQLSQRKFKTDEPDNYFLRKQISGKSFYIRSNKMDHQDFSSNYLLVKSFTPDSLFEKNQLRVYYEPIPKAEKRRCYELTKGLVKTFFDASLKGEEKKYNDLSKTIVRFKADFIEYEIRN
ncbi:MAG TPA: acyl-CoA thioester hydrolase/BAAT C-terminal domain-containing protein [Chryseolinea sp.]